MRPFFRLASADTRAPARTHIQQSRIRDRRIPANTRSIKFLLSMQCTTRKTGQRNDPDASDTCLYLIDKIESDAMNALPNLTQESTMTEAKKITRRAPKKTAAKTLNVNMLGASDASAQMDPDIASLLSVLGEGGNLPAVETVEHTAAPVIESSDVIEQAAVETLDVSAGLPAVQAEIILPAELLDVPVAPSDEALSAAIAGLEVQEHYSLVPADAAPHDPLNDEEAAKERLLAEEALGDEARAAVAGDAPAAATTEPAAAKPARAPRTHYQNKTDRIKARLGEKLGDYLVLELDDASLEGDALKAKQDETLAVIDAMSVKVKNRASLLIDWLSGKTGKPNEILKRALDVLAADGKITTGDNGNLHKNLIAKPYSPSAARAMGRNTVTVMEKTKMIVAGAKGEYLPNPASLFLAMAQQLTGAEPLAEETAEEPPVEPTPEVTPAATVEEPAVETVEAAEEVQDATQETPAAD